MTTKQTKDQSVFLWFSVNYTWNFTLVCYCWCFSCRSLHRWSRSCFCLAKQVLLHQTDVCEERGNVKMMKRRPLVPPTNTIHSNIYLKKKFNTDQTQERLRGRKMFPHYIGEVKVLPTWGTFGHGWRFTSIGYWVTFQLCFIPVLNFCNLLQPFPEVEIWLKNLEVLEVLWPQNPIWLSHTYKRGEKKSCFSKSRHCYFRVNSEMSSFAPILSLFLEIRIEILCILDLTKAT